MLRILIYSMNFSPELTGIGKYSGEMATWLAERGHSVWVVTAPPFYPEWRVHSGFSQGYSRESVPSKGNYWVIRSPLYVPQRGSGLRRVVHLCSFALSSLPLVLRYAKSIDVILMVEPSLVCAPATLLASALFRTRSWLHVQDFEVDAAFNLGLLPSAWRRTGLWLESAFMARFDRVSTISQRMLEGLSKKGVSTSRARYFPNWVDTTLIHPLEGPSALRQTLGIPNNKIVVLYSGSMGHKQGLEVLLDAADCLREYSQIHMLICGEGPGREELVAAAESRGLQNVTFSALQPLARLNELLNVADIHLLPQRKEAADLVMPSKLTGMFASGRPIVAGAELNTSIATAVTGKGVVVRPEDAGALADAILKLAEDPAERVRLGCAARRYAELELSKDAVLSRLENDLVELTAKRCH